MLFFVSIEFLVFIPEPRRVKSTRWAVAAVGVDIQAACVTDRVAVQEPAIRGTASLAFPLNHRMDHGGLAWCRRAVKDGDCAAAGRLKPIDRHRLLRRVGNGEDMGDRSGLRSVYRRKRIAIENVRSCKERKHMQAHQFVLIRLR